MDFVVKMTGILLLFVFMWLYQEQNQEWDITRNLIKDANNFAVHDAVQQIDDIEKSQGRIIIDPDRAKEVLKETLQLNLGLDDQLRPKTGSPLRSPVEIVDMIILDESNTSTFPFLYENQTYHITKWVQGPFVISVIKTPHPKFINWIDQSPIQVPSIQEYQFY